jgi:electron transport complex protein RnfC
MLTTLKRFFSPKTQPSDNKIAPLTPLLPPLLPSKLYLPLYNERQLYLQAKVSISQHILKNQIIAEGIEPSALLHSPVAGTVLDIIQHPSCSPPQKKVQTIVIQPSMEDPWKDEPTLPLNEEIISSQLALLSEKKLEILHTQLEKSGIMGMGGAGFSTIEKIKISHRKAVHTVLINLCECEPIISCDQGLSEQQPEEILMGTMSLLNCIQAKQAVIIIEDNKAIAIKKLQSYLQNYPHITLKIVPNIYPSGHEKQLVSYITNTTLTAEEKPYDLGYAVFNVATCYAFYRACHLGEPLTQRLITISNGEKNINQWALIGTPIIELLDAQGIKYDSNNQNLIMGGPMNGLALNNSHIGVAKNTNCLVVLPKNQTHTSLEKHSPCIRCGECVAVCPSNLLPQQLFWYAQAQQNEKSEQYRLFDCIECGNCAFVCPSKIPLVHYYRQQKKDISEKKLEQYKIQIAKERYEKRLIRLEEKRQKHQKMLEQKRLQAQQKLAQKNKQKALQPTSENSSQEAVSAAVAKARATALSRKNKNQSKD